MYVSRTLPMPVSAQVPFPLLVNSSDGSGISGTVISVDSSVLSSLDVSLSDASLSVPCVVDSSSDRLSLVDWCSSALDSDCSR